MSLWTSTHHNATFTNDSGIPPCSLDIKNYFHFRESGRQDKTQWKIEFMSCFPHIWATILALVILIDRLKIKAWIFIFKSLDILPGISCKFIFPLRQELAQHRMNNELILLCCLYSLEWEKNVYDLIFKEFTLPCQKKGRWLRPCRPFSV